MKKIILILSIICFVGATITHAQKPEIVTSKKPGWQKIGEATVDFKTDKDQFIILGADRFKSIQLKVKDATIHIEDMQIHYEGGEKEDVALRAGFKAGEESRVIDLKNNSAELKKVVFVYRTLPNAAVTKAEIELWGRK